MRKSIFGICRRYISENSKIFDEKVISLGNRLLDGKRESLAKAITLIESTRRDHQQLSSQLFEYISIRRFTSLLQSSTFSNSYTLRLGIAGPPGAGKSTFIESLGLRLITSQLKVAVIPVDPSSHISGGSILGDKTRMELLSRSDNAYIRASPTRGVLGGIAEHTADIVNLCEANGYGVTIIESVGLGQSEVDIDMAVDMLLVLLPPGGGDGLQASKKGIMEIADMIVVNKADGELLAAAKHTKADYSGAMQFIRQKHYDWKVPVLLISSKSGFGIDDVEKQIYRFHEIMSSNGSLVRKRALQSSHWIKNQFTRMVIHDAMNSNHFRESYPTILESVVSGKLSSRQAATLLFDQYKKS